jgi:hypothetical protein
MTDPTKTEPYLPGHGTRLDNFLKEEGVLEEFQAAAIKEVIAWQNAGCPEAIKKAH